jgi:selenocysteine lyase/cysteine desulfurase
MVAKAMPSAADDPVAPAIPQQLPDKASFLPFGCTYLNSGYQHPIPIASKRASDMYFAKRMLDPAAMSYERPDDQVRAKFANLINAASPDEIGYVQSTTIGEQIVLRGLGLPQSGGRVVVDTLHFYDSFPAYMELARQGVDVTWVRDKDGRIPLADMKQAIRPGTKLVSLSAVSTVNGFGHDLKAVCDIAHANGALVYADIVHAAGCVPLDVKATGVDFAAGSTYKWLMGDFGLGFVYARKDVQNRLRRTEFGYLTLSRADTHIYPYDPPGNSVIDYAWEDTAAGHFAHGTISFHVIAQLDRSLDYIMGIGVPVIQAHVQKLVSQLKRELPRLGYPLMTPPESASPIVTCIFPDAYEKLTERLNAANLKITLGRNRFRITPSVFNDEADVNKLLSALGHA